MILLQPVPNYIRERYISYKGDTTFGRKNWIARAIKGEEYYYNDVEHTGTTYTSSQHRKIAEVTGLPVSINWLHPIINQKLAILAQTKPSMRTISLDGRAQEYAMVLDKMKHGVLYNSNALNEITEHIKDALISGMGCLMVVPTNMYTPGLFNVSVRHVPYDEVILDINSKRRDLEDMEGFFIEKVYTMPKVMQLYGEIIAQLVSENGEPVHPHIFSEQVWVESDLTEKQDVTTTQYNQDQRIITREYFEKVYTNMYMIKSPDGIIEYVFAENLLPEQQGLLEYAEKAIPDLYVKRCVLLGDWKVFEEVLPITKFPLRALFFEWGGRPYRSYGMPHFTISMQEAYDKLLQIFLLNGILTNNAGYIAPKGSIAEEDRKFWEEHGNDPTRVKEYVPKYGPDGKALVPTKEQVGQLSNFYPMTMEMLRSGIEYSTGITPILQGDPGQAGVEVFSSLQQYQNAAMMRIMLMSGFINQTMTELGQVLNEYLTASIKPDHYFFFDDKGDMNELNIALEIVNDIKLFRYLTVSIPAALSPTQKLSASIELMKIAQSDPDPNARRIYTETAMEMTEIKEFDKAQEKLDVAKNLQGQLQQVNEAYERLMETSKQMENKLINASVENRILKQLMGKEAKIAEKYGELSATLSMAENLQKQEEKEE